MYVVVWSEAASLLACQLATFARLMAAHVDASSAACCDRMSRGIAGWVPERRERRVVSGRKRPVWQPAMRLQTSRVPNRS